MAAEMFSLKFYATFDTNAAWILNDVNVFWLYFLGYDATIKSTSLQNSPVMLGSLPSNVIVISIFDYTEHMRAGGKKNSSFILKEF